MVKEIDARGLSCPQPVVQTKKEIESGAAELVVLVDNKTACQNVTRFAISAGFKVDEEKAGDDYELHLTKGSPVSECESVAAKSSLIFIDSEIIGRGSEELGATLMKTFLHTLTESPEQPAKIVFMNSGVKLAAEGSESIADLKELADKGVEILACGTCLDYFGLKEKVAVGKVSNMYEILSSFLQAEKVITL